MDPTLSADSQCPLCGVILPDDAVNGCCPRCLMFGAMQSTQAGDQAPAMPALTPEELAPHFPQLEILECLGRGGMGVVYKARQKSLNRLVALKLLAPERADDPQFAARFEKEAHALAALNHPNIVGVHDFGQAGGFYFLLMEFVDGVNLRQLLQTKRLTPKEALSIVPPVCDALQCAHDHGIVHRDIKPENLLMDKSGMVKIADFGIAKIVGDPTDLTDLSHSAQGTPDYAAPEQSGGTADHRADIYSLGVVLYEMLTGERPNENITPPSKRVQVDIRIDEIVLRALEKTPGMRFQTAADFRTQVEAAAHRDSAAWIALKPWEQRWLAWTEGQRAFLQGILFLLALTLTLCFGWIHREVVPSPPNLAKGEFQREVRIHVGAGNPWLTEVEKLTHRGRNTGSEFHRGTPSFFCGLGALAVWILLVRLVRVTQGKVLIRLRSLPDGKGQSRVIWPNVIAAWVGVVATVTLSTMLLIAAMTSFGRGGPPVIPSILLSVIPASLVVFMGLRLPQAGNETTVLSGASNECAAPEPRLQSRWQGWDVWVIGLCLVIFGALWLLRLSEGPLLNRSLFAGAGVGSNIVLPIALATTILLAGAAFLYMLARNIKTAAPTRSESCKRTLGRAVVPTIAVVLLVRTFVIHPFVVPNNSMSPEITKGSRILVWKLTSTYAPGDIVAYRHEDKVWVARVTQAGQTTLTLQKNSKLDSVVQREAVVGKVISVFWRPSRGAVTAEKPSTPNPMSSEIIIEQSGNASPAEAVRYKITADTTGYGKPPGPEELLDVLINIHGVNPTDPTVKGTLGGTDVLVLPLVRSARVISVDDPNPATTNSRDVVIELELTDAEIALIKEHEYRRAFTFSPVHPPLGTSAITESEKLKQQFDDITKSVIKRYRDVVANPPKDPGTGGVATFSLPSLPGKVSYVNGTGRNGRPVIVVSADIKRSGQIHWPRDRVEQECYTTEQAASLVTNLLAAMNIKKEISVVRRELLAKALCDLTPWFPVALCGYEGSTDCLVWAATGVRGVSIVGIDGAEQVSATHTFYTVPDFKIVKQINVEGYNFDTIFRWLRHEIDTDALKPAPL